MPVITQDIPFFSHRRTAQTVTPAPALTLVDVTYETGTFVQLTFDRAIDISATDVLVITVDDGDNGFRYRGTGTAEQPAPATVYVILDGLEELPLEGVHLNATNANGIVAADDATAWAGVSELELPFPP